MKANHRPFGDTRAVRPVSVSALPLQSDASSPDSLATSLIVPSWLTYRLHAVNAGLSCPCVQSPLLAPLTGAPLLCSTPFATKYTYEPSSDAPAVIPTISVFSPAAAGLKSVVSHRNAPSSPTVSEHCRKSSFSVYTILESSMLAA